jgi:tRNA modification GTPase
MTADIIGEISHISGEMHEAVRRARTGERVRDGLRVVIAGPPNAGKSTLLNALAQRDVAIVSEQPGTTRDALEVHLDIGGYPMMITDTAGLRQPADVVEQIGIERALARAAQSDLILWLVPPEIDALAFPDIPGGGEVWTLFTKSDLATGHCRSAKLAISAKNGSGLDLLLAELERFAETKLGASGEAAVLTRERHRLALEEAVHALDRIMADHHLPPEIVAEEIRLAQHAVGRIAGRIDVEDVLGEVFGRFCIGK